MKILVVGSGGREHAIAWKLAESPRVTALYAAPGNAGTASLGANLPILATDLEGIAGAALRHKIDLVVVGPEAPLAAGLVDLLERRGIPAFGPTRDAAALEWSKGFSKDLMRRYGIPCAPGECFDDYDQARRYVESLPEPPVIKADGLAQGKGVAVPETHAEALAALEACMVQGAFGEAGRTVVIEQRLYGLEASVFALCDGETALATVPACDYKRALDADRGPNTGGMGSYSPPEFLGEGMAQRIEETVLKPALRAMAQEGRPFKGVLYAGLMIDGQQATVLEFNCRLGDPETQVILPRLQTDLLDVIEAALGGRLHQVKLQWRAGACVGVVVASGGYPAAYETGYPITGLDEADAGTEAMVFHAATKRAEGRVLTDGGRVLTVAALGPTVAEARERAYARVERISFTNAHYRKDIGLRAAGT